MTQSIRESALIRVVTHLLPVILLTLLLTLAVRLVLDHTLELRLDQRFWYRDYAGNLVVSLLCLALTRSWRRTMVLAGILIVGFQAGNAGKLVVLGTPISPDDFIHIKNLFLLWKGWMLWAAIVAIALPLVAFALLVRWRTIATWATLGLTGAVISLTFFYSEDLRAALDRNFGNSVWNQPENFKRRGLGLHILQESVRTIAKVGQIPVKSEVTAALQSMPGAQARPRDTIDKRNVHMVVLEFHSSIRTRSAPNECRKTRFPKRSTPCGTKPAAVPPWRRCSAATRRIGRVRSIVRIPGHRKCGVL